jgi:hypothetical protein
MRRLVCSAVAVLAALLTAALAGPASAVPNAHHLQNGAGGLPCLGIHNSSPRSGVAVVGPCNLSSPTQQWTPVPKQAADGTVYFAFVTSNAFCLGVTGASQSIGATVVLGACTFDHSQLWREEQGRGWFTLRNYHSGLCAEAGPPVIVQEPCGGTARRSWRYLG